VEGGFSSDFSSTGGLVSTDDFLLTKLVQLNAIRHALSVSWRSVLGIIVAERPGSLREHHQSDCAQTTKIETHRLLALGFRLPWLETSVGGLVLSV
jgi:hypothetical protein